MVMATGSIKKQLQTTTIPVTTNGNGVAGLGLTQANVEIVCATVQDKIAIPFIVGSGKNWWIKVLEWSSMAATANTAVSVVVSYYSAN